MLRQTAAYRCAGLLLGTLLMLSRPAVAAETSVEFRLKAAFLLNFAKLVEWPATRFKGSEDPLRLCVLGADPFGPVLDGTIKGKRIGKRPITVIRSAAAKDLLGCHLVYLGAGERSRYTAHMKALSDRSILTVDEGNQFTWPLGMIRFYLDKDRVRFEVNPSAMEKAKLQMDPKMVKIARIVSQ